MVLNATSDQSPFFSSTAGNTNITTTTTTTAAASTATATSTSITTPKRRSLDNNGLPRPPTPPRESPRSKKASQSTTTSTTTPGGGSTKDPFAATDSNILIAESSPPPSSESSLVDKPKKRVLWSPWTKYHKPDVPLTSTPIRTLIDAKTLKGILKPSPVPQSAAAAAGVDPSSPLGRPIAAHTFTSFASMLESVLTALASPERSRKLDTYITFSNTLKAYDEIPDLPALETHLPALCAFIRRDLSATLEDGGNTDSQLIQQAIKLLVILAWTPRLVEAMDDTDAAFFLDHAIARVEDSTTPKIIVNHNLHLLAQQKFPPRVMTPERAARIVTALETLDDRVTGKSITKERIDIYYKLLYQAKLTMAARISDWMDNLFGGLLSSVTEVRNRALICIAEVSRVLGRDKAVPRTLTNIFSRQIKGKRMFDSIKERLDQFIRDGEGVFVARMWGIVLLCVKTLGDHWEYFTPWLRIIEGCFNVSDKDVKVEAQVAWSKLIYSMNIGPNTTRKLLGLLCKPLEQYLDPKNAYSNTKKPRKAAMANVSVLLYYGFRPTASAKQLSDVWDLVVVGLVEKMALSSKEEVGEGCAILSAIFDSTRPRAWQETRVLAAPPMAPEDVPRLDPKWVRSNTALVLNTLEVALRRGHWKEEADRGVKSLWAHFTKTLSDAGSKEIIVSAELMEAVANLFNMLQRIWTAGPSALLGAKENPPTMAASFIKKFSFLVVTALQSLGTIPFTEKHLSYDDDAARFAPAATPTQKYASSGTAVLNPPILHLFQLFLHPPADVFPDEEYYESVRTILWRCVASQDSRRKKLTLLASCTALLPHRDARDLDQGMWQIFGQLARRCLPREKTTTAPAPAVAEFRDVVRILEWGCPYELQGWQRLYEEFCAVVASEQGEAYVAAVVIEPIAEVLRNQAVEQDKTAQSMKKAVMLVERAAWPKAEKTFLKMQFGGAGRKAMGTDSYEKLCELLDHLLRRAYAEDAGAGAGAEQTLLALMAATGDMLARCPPGSLLQMLKRLQEGVGLFVADERQTVGPAVHALWAKVLEACGRLPAHDGKVLDALQTLVTAGLRAKRKQVVNLTVKFWNDTFGGQSALLYPSSVRGALRKLRPIADLALPTFPESLEDEPPNTPPEFSETQSQPEDTNSLTIKVTTPLRMASPFRKSASPGMMPPTTTTTNARRTLNTAAGKPPPKLKLKHMDSQIEFEHVDSGGGPAGVMDSQVLTEHQKEVKERQSTGEAAKLLASLVVKTEKEKEKEAVVLEDSPAVSRVEETQPEVNVDVAIGNQTPTPTPTPSPTQPDDNGSDYGSSISELPDDFVDAPDEPDGSRKRGVTVTVEVAVPAEPRSSPDVQIIDEQQRASAAAKSGKRKAKKKKEKEASPEVLGTIVIGTPSRVRGIPTRFSPPRTRASARKAAQGTPPVAVVVEPVSRKRKFAVTPTNTTNAANDSYNTEHAPSPTPKSRRRKPDTAAAPPPPPPPPPPPTKRTRVMIESVPADPDISFVGETQLSYGSSSGATAPDTYEQEVDELVGATPYAGVFDGETPAKRRRSEEAAAAAVTPSRKRRVVVEEEEEEEEEGEEGVPPSSQPEAVVSTTEESGGEAEGGREAVEALRVALVRLDAAVLTDGLAREAEDVILGAFMRIRTRGR